MIELFREIPKNLSRLPLVPVLRINYEPATLTAKRWLEDQFSQAKIIKKQKERHKRWIEEFSRDKSFAVFGNAGYGELFFRTTADGTAVTANATETTLLPANTQPVIPANAFMFAGRSFRFTSKGILTTTTSNSTWQLRMSGTVNSLAGTSIGVTATITNTGSVNNVLWYMMYDMEARTDMSSGAANTTLSGSGIITSPAGFASPFAYSLIQAAGSATWTWTSQADIQNYINWSLTFSAASQSATLKSFKAYCEN